MSVNIEKNNIKKYLLSDVISQFGSGMSFISLNWFVFQQTGSNNSVGIVMMLGILGGVLATFFSGVIADHFNRKSVLIFSNGLRALCILLALYSMMYGQFSVLSAYVLSFTSGVGLHIYMTASRAFMQELVERDSVIKWQSCMEISMQASMLVSGILTGFLYNLFGMNVILGIEVFSFFISSVLLCLIKYQGMSYQVSKDQFLQKYLKGYGYFKSNSGIFIFALVMNLPYVATVTLNTVMPSYVSQHLYSDAVTYSMMCMSYGIGGTLAGLVVMHSSSKYSYLLKTNAFLCLSIASLLALFFNKAISFSYFFIFLFGLANSSIKIILNSTLMRNISHEYMGRALSVINLVSTVLQMGSTYLVSILIDRFSQFNGFMFLISIMLISYGLFTCFLPKFKNFITSKSYN